MRHDCPAAQHVPAAFGLLGSVHRAWAQQTPCALLELPWQVWPVGQQTVPLGPVHSCPVGQQVFPLKQVEPEGQQVWPPVFGSTQIAGGSQQVLPLMHCWVPVHCPALPHTQVPVLSHFIPAGQPQVGWLL